MNNDIERILKSILEQKKCLHTVEEIISWFTSRKTFADLNISLCNISSITDWEYSNGAIVHKEGKFFKVIGIRATIGNREVASWDQPLIEQRQEGIIGFIAKEIQGVLHFLVQAKMECGNFDTLEMAPTVQCITGSYKEPLWEVPFLEYFLDDAHSVSKENTKVLLDTVQSEEGGRFYHEQNRNIIVEVGENFPVDVPDNYIWLTLGQMKEFIKFNNYLNVEARSLIACISVI